MVLATRSAVKFEQVPSTNSLWSFIVPGRFLWFQVGFSGRFFMGFHGSRLVFPSSRWVLMIIHNSRSVFMVSGWFFMVPGRFLWFFMVPGQFLWFFKVLGRFLYGSRWFFFYSYSRFQVSFSCFFMISGCFFGSGLV